MNIFRRFMKWALSFSTSTTSYVVRAWVRISNFITAKRMASKIAKIKVDERGDVPGWVLVVLMTTGLVTAIWTIAAPRLSSILRNSLDSMNAIR